MRNLLVRNQKTLLILGIIFSFPAVYHTLAWFGVRLFSDRNKEVKQVFDEQFLFGKLESWDRAFFLFNDTFLFVLPAMAGAVFLGLSLAASVIEENPLPTKKQLTVRYTRMVILILDLASICWLLWTMM